MSTRAIKGGKAEIEVGLNRKGVEKGLKALELRMKATSKMFGSIGKGLTTAAGVGALAFAPLIGRFAVFDDSMRAVQGVTQATEAEMETLRTTAKRLGATTSYTAAQVGELMTVLGQLGFKPEQIDAMTGAVLNLGRATRTEVPLAAGIMGAALQQFELSADQAGRVADVLAATANKSSTTLEQLGEALQYAGPVANDFDMSIEDTAAIIGTLGNVGIQASAAGTVVRRLLNLTGAEAQRLQQIFGVAFIDTAGNARPLIDVLEEVNQATANMGSAERAKRFSDAFGLLGVTGASALGKAAGSARKLAGELRDAQGTAEKTAKAMDGGLGGAIRFVVSAIDGVVTAIGESLDAELQTLADLVISVTDAIRHFVEGNRGLVVAVGASVIVAGLAGGVFLALAAATKVVAMSASVAVVAYGAVTAILGVFNSVAMWAVAVYSLLTTVIAALNGSLAAQAVIAGTLTGIWASIGAVIGAISLPAIAVAAAVTALGAAIVGVAAVALYRSGLIGDAFGYLKGVLVDLFAIATEAFAGIKEALAAGEYMTAVKILWAGLKQAFWYGVKEVVSIVRKLPGMIWDVMKRFTVSFLKTLWNLFTSIPEILAAALSGVNLSDAILARVDVGDWLDGLAANRIADAKKEIRGLRDELVGLNNETEKGGAAKPGQLAPSPSGAIVPGYTKPGVAGSSAEQKANANSRIETLKDEIRVLQMGADAAEDYKLAREGVAPKEIEMVQVLRARKRALEEESEAVEAAREASEQRRVQLAAEAEDRKRQAEDVRESLKTPLQKFREEVQRIAGLVGSGELNVTDGRAAIRNLQAKYAKENQTEAAQNPTLGFAARGSKGAFEALARTRGLAGDGAAASVPPWISPLVQAANQELQAAVQLPQRLAAEIQRQTAKALDLSGLEEKAEMQITEAKLGNRLLYKVATNTAKASTGEGL